MVHALRARRDYKLASRKLVIITGRSCERVDHKAGLHFTLLRIKHECWQQLKSWKKLVKKLHCQTKSEITTRNDAHSDAVKTVNRRLKQFSRQNGWKLISHANITQNGLNKGGLNLNREGNDSLHRNFVNFLRNNN